MRREYPPAPLVAVAAFVLRGGRFLLVRRAAEPGRGKWSIPGGVVRLGERLREAVVREVAEECGLIVEVVDLLDVVETIIRDEAGRIRFHYVIVDYLARPVGGTLRPSDDALEARWASVEEALGMDITNTLRRLLEEHGDKLRSLAELWSL
ncbi:hypothetical protein DRO32_01565 [Candidatus Bathyarchaeota archaeon]|nr:MAG: hypothetical protein DRO32_01565 [Candidatus Bathyarchaeota archaeon]